MKNGLYEVLMTNDIDKKLNKKNYETRKVDQSEIAKVVSLDQQKVLRKKLKTLSKDEQIEFIKELNVFLDMELYEYNEESMVELLSVHEDGKKKKELDIYRPKTSISTSTLFTGVSGPSLESELKREIRTSDKIDFLVSFIKFSGLRLIYDDLVEYTKTNKLRVITTSYMGASDYKAVLKLAELPNTEVKVSYDDTRTRLHAKAYLFKRETGFTTAYIGSSNLSNPALSKGLEWNLKVSEYTSPDVINKFNVAFDTYWNDEEFKTFEPNNIEHQQELKDSLKAKGQILTSNIFFDLKPYSYQKEILEDLETERVIYDSYKNLIVAATGTGKTMVAAFDYKEFRKKNKNHKILFLAHRKEILEQSLMTFRAVLKDQNFGDLWGNGATPSQTDFLFATIQTLNSKEKYKQFPNDHFDYLIIDESHHASATSYLRVIDYFEPKILLGLTATPERMDGNNILDHFNNRIASEIRLPDAINRKLLSPFHYFGITDSINLGHMKWTRGAYDVSELENVYTKDNQRIATIIKSMDTYLASIEDMKAIGFCVSINHANFMASQFNKANIPAIALHSGSSAELRDRAKQRLQKKEINIIFTVDLFNEGVDIPDVNTVLFLRPTESLTVFLQQLGRGLRLEEDKDALTVLDFVGQAHKNYDFSKKYRALIGKNHRNLKDEIIEEFPNMPAGCHIHLERIAKEYILRNIQSATFNKTTLINMIKEYKLNFTTELNLNNFLSHYGIDKSKFYSKFSFRELLFQAGIIEEYKSENYKELRASLRRVANMDSKRLLLFTKSILENPLKLDLTTQEEKLLNMLHFTVWGDKPKVSFRESLNDLVNRNEDIKKEYLEIIDYNLKHQKVIEKPYEESHIPIEIYASYNIDQVMSVFNKNTEKHKFPMRQGAIHIKNENTDIFFITINKSESDYLPTTMYNDYAINNQFFHWESQSTITTSSNTGKRYIEDRTEKHKILLFVREKKNIYGKAAPYIFLGNAKYVSHKGNKPIQIVWKLDHSIPERIIKESKLKMVE